MIKDILLIKRDIPALEPEIVATVFGYPIANSVVMGLLITLLLFFVGLFTYKAYRLKPSKVQLSFEVLYGAIIDLVKQLTGGSEKHASRISLIIFALLVYLLITNLIGFIPGLSQITVGDMALFKAPSADFNTTFALALGAVIAIQAAAVYEKGAAKYIMGYFPVDKVFNGFKKSAGAGAMSFIDVFVGLLDLVGEAAKVVSLSLRLFGNMFAGNVLAVIILGASAYLLPALWMGMNLFTSLLQALVFAALIAAYYMLAMPEEAPEPQEAPLLAKK